MSFHQEPPSITNQYLSDDLLRAYIQTTIPNQHLEEIEEDLTEFGERVIGDIYQMGQDAYENEPELINFDVWGNRIDQIKVSKGWNSLQDVASEEGLIAIGYDREYDEFSRIYQMAKLYLYTPSSAIYTCPLAMADGAARLIEKYATDQLSDTFDHLTSRNPEKFWVAGQWMTERSGGSDLGRAETIAKPNDDGSYNLSGDKWFTSAATAPMAMTLARIEQDDGSVVEGSRGLSLFYLETGVNNNLNGIQINALKDKLGTKSLPTAELTLEDCKAIHIGEEGKGVKLISTILNITRIYNAMSSISYLRRGLALALDYAEKREAFGRKLLELPLHRQTLAEIQVTFHANFLFVFYVIELLGKVETDVATDQEEKILRLLTPVVKLFTAKQAISGISEIVECFGGAGYLEETGIPVLLRDAQVFSIWEGTTNVLSLDTLRALQKANAFQALHEVIITEISQLDSFDKERKQIEMALEALATYIIEMQEKGRKFSEQGARKFAFSIARVVCGFLLLRSHSQFENEKIKKKIKSTIYFWFQDGLTDLIKTNDIENTSSLFD